MVECSPVVLLRRNFKKIKAVVHNIGVVDGLLNEPLSSINIKGTVQFYHFVFCNSRAQSHL